MGLFKSAGKLLGLSGGGEIGNRVDERSIEIANRLRNFTPIRIRTSLGTGTYDQSGVSLDLDPTLNAGTRSGLDLFKNSVDRLAEFDEGGSIERTLGLLRARRAPKYDTDLSRLESRLLQQGRLGLATGSRYGNPELASFFGAEADADLAAQLAASGEARAQRQDLLGSAAGGLALAQESSLPSQFMQGLFNAESLRSAREFAAAKIETGGVDAAAKGAQSDLNNRASFFGNFISSFFPRPTPTK